MKLMTSISFLAISTGLLVSCSSHPPAVNFDATTTPEQAVKKVEQSIKEAREQQYSVSAPKSFENARSAYKEAKEDLKEGDESSEILESAGQALAYLKQAKERSKIAKPVINETLSARKKALEAGAPARAEELFKETDERLVEATSEIEDGNLEKARARQKELTNSYLKAELISIKDKHIGKAAEWIKKADEQDADDMAPISFKSARQAYQRAERIIGNDRTNNAAIDKAADNANAEAYKLILVLQETKKAGGSKAEKLAITKVEQQKKINRMKLQKILAQHQSSAQQKMINRYQEEVAQDRVMQAMVSTFDDERAEVYRQGNDVIIRMRGVNFAVNDSKISPKDYALLGKVKGVIEQYNVKQVVVEGHTDSTGTKNYNKTLSLKRAKAVSSYLTSNSKLTNSQVKTVGKGYEEPLSDNKSDKGRKLNRRIDVILKNIKA